MNSLTSTSLEEWLKQAAKLHQAGNMQEAGNLYRRILDVSPTHAEANHNMGVLAVQMNEAAAGIPFLMNALEANPTQRQYWLSYLDALIKSEQLDAAREVLALVKQQGLQGEEVANFEACLDARAYVFQFEPVTLPVVKPTKIKSSLRQKEPSAQEIEVLVALFGAGKLAEAASLAQAMTEQFPQHGFGWKALGTVLKQMGRNAEALMPMQKAAVLSPTEADVHSNLGVTLQDLGRFKEAKASYRKALKINPNYADAHCNLGSLLQESELLDEAVSCYQRALRLNPSLAEAHYNLGNVLRNQGRQDDAVKSYRQALQLNPAYVQACCNLGVLLNDLVRLDEAETILRRALEINPNHAEAHSNLGNTLKELGRLDEAEASYRRALAIKPEQAEVHNNLGNLLQDMGRLSEAEARYRCALQCKPDYDKAHSNLLFLLNYNPEITAEFAFAEAKKYGKRIAAKVTSRFTEWSCVQQPARLRIGFVSGDFRNHPVGYFLENLLRHLDQNKFELIAYPTDSWVDELTLRIKSYFSAWKPLVGLNDGAAAKLIHGDGVHILIDLSGHSRYNRLPVFAWKPAPVQVAWLGYFATTGVYEIDYLIADAVTLPKSEEKYFTEKIWRLPETRLCFTPPKVELAVSPLPALANDYVTFGCFNNLSKMNDDVVALWARVLHAVPSSRLFLKSRQLGEVSIWASTLTRFAAHGIEAERLILEGAESRAKYFAAYQRVDIALDPFPYPGGTTTVESLWMGVPVLNLAGSSFLFRQGAGFLTHAGLPDWIADSQADYVQRAIAHVSNLPLLAELHMGLRQQVELSPIMDGRRFAGNFGESLWRIWQEARLTDMRQNTVVTTIG